MESKSLHRITLLNLFLAIGLAVPDESHGQIDLESIVKQLRPNMPMMELLPDESTTVRYEPVRWTKFQFSLGFESGSPPIAEVGESLTLSVPAVSASDKQHGKTIAINVQDARRVFALLTAEGFFNRSVPIDCSFSFQPWYRMSVRYSHRGHVEEVRMFQGDLLELLARLENILDGDAKNAVRQLQSKFGEHEKTWSDERSKWKDAAREHLATRRLDLTNLAVDVIYNGDEQHPSLTLGASLPNKDCDHPLVRIDKDQANKILDLLIESGYFTIAQRGDYHGRDLSKLPWNSYFLAVRLGDGRYDHHATPLLWDVHMLDQLDALRSATTGDAAKAMDKILAALAPQRRQWNDMLTGKMPEILASPHK